MKKDIQEAAGLLQMANGFQSDTEAAIHSMKKIFDDEQADAVILVDASNAFNSLNGNADLHNIQILSPQFSTIFLRSMNIVSNKGATQGDNLGMSFYARGTATLLNYFLIFSPIVKNVCLADAGTLLNFKKWWSTIIYRGFKVSLLCK